MTIDIARACTHQAYVKSSSVTISPPKMAGDFFRGVFYFHNMFCVYLKAENVHLKYYGIFIRANNRDIYPMLGQSWASVADGGPTLTQY